MSNLSTEHELERLTQECGRKDAIVQAQKIHCEGQRADIERLKAKNRELDEIVIGLRDRSMDKDRLITEMADELAMSPSGLTPKSRELIKRAKVATHGT